MVQNVPMLIIVSPFFGHVCFHPTKRKKKKKRDLGRILKVAPVRLEITLGADKNSKKVRAGPECQYLINLPLIYWHTNI